MFRFFRLTVESCEFSSSNIPFTIHTQEIINQYNFLVSEHNTVVGRSSGQFPGTILHIKVLISSKRCSGIGARMMRIRIEKDNFV